VEYSPAMDDQGRAIIEPWMDAFNRRDEEAFRSLCTPEVEIRPMRAAVDGTSYSGPGAVADFFRETNEIWDDLEVRYGSSEAIENGLLVQGTLKGRGRGSGVDTEMELIWVFRFRDGLAARVEGFADPAEARRAASASWH